MKHQSVTRVVAATAVVALLAAFSAPAAAGPLGGVAPTDSWSPSVLVQWVQSLWAGWFGTGEPAPGTSGPEKLHGRAGAVTEPDGFTATSPAEDDSSMPGSDDGTF